MFNRHVSRQLAAHLDGALAASQARQVELHVADCERCRAERELIRSGMAMLDELAIFEAPEAIWSAIEAANPRPQPRAPRWQLVFAPLAIVVAVALVWWITTQRAEPGWELTRSHGAAQRVKAGAWIETDAASIATLKVGEIGAVEVEPNTRLRVVMVRPKEHRLSLVRGEIRAKIFAPPRLFLVDTAAGTAVDLGCEYSLRSEEDGAGLLQVTRGWVSFQWKGLESLVPAGASCRIEPPTGPGVPHFDDAPESFKQALDTLAMGPQKSGIFPLDAILAAARVRDTLTLWHLLGRVGPTDRKRIYDRMAALTPVPAGVSREKAMALDPATLTRWKDELAWTW